MRPARRAFLACSLALGLWPLAALAQSAPAPAAAPAPAPAVPPEPLLRVIVSIPPLKGLVQPLLPPGSTVDVLIPPGVSEHGYEIPLPKLADLGRAHVVVLVGLGLEPQIEKFLAGHASRGSRREVVFAKVVEDVVKAAEAHHHHDEPGHVHGPECDHGPADPHLWLDPVLTMRLVPAISAAIDESLGAVAGGSADAATRAAWSLALDGREESLLDRLRTLDADFKRQLARCPKKSLIVAHDAWGWLAKRYGLVTVPIAGLTAAEPTPKAIADVVKTAREQKLPAIFFEPQISPAAAQRVAQATGLKLLRIDPLGDGDYLALMRNNLSALVEGLGGVPEPAATPRATPGGGQPASR